MPLVALERHTEHMTTTATEAFEVVAETVVSVDLEEETESPVVTFEVGDRVRIAPDAATSVAGYAVSSDALGRIGTLDYLDVHNGWYVIVEIPGYRYGLGQYVDPKYLTKLTEAELLREELAKVTEAKEAAERAHREAADALTRQAAEHEAWKANLQQVAYDAAELNEMCAVFDQVMEKVGLEGREREIELRVRFDGYAYVSVMATSRSNAIDELDSDMIKDAVQRISDYSDNLSWSVDEDYGS